MLLRSIASERQLLALLPFVFELKRYVILRPSLDIIDLSLG